MSSEVARTTSQIARTNGIRLRNLLLAHERWLTSEQVAALTRTDADPEAYTGDLIAAARADFEGGLDEW
jgi:hypothetical protein